MNLVTEFAATRDRSKRRRAIARLSYHVLVVGVLVVLARPAAAQRDQPTNDDVLEQYAFSVGLQAYLYGYPLVITEVSRQAMTTTGGRPGAPPMVANRFRHFPHLVTPALKSAVSANVDTLFSTAWLDLSSGPVVLHVPDMQGRYYVVQFNDFYTNSFAYVGSRTTGTREQRFLVVGPDWKGGAPGELKVIRCPTNGVFVAARILVDGERDVRNVAPLQEAMTFVPLSPATAPPAPAGGAAAATATPPEAVAKMDAATFFGTMTRLMQLYPPPAQDAAMVKQFERIGIDLDYGFDGRKLDAATLRGLERAARTAVPFLQAAGSRLGGREVNGWWTPRGVGVFGTDYVLRAYMALDFIWGNVAEEAVYAMGSVDGKGRPLDGAHRYILHFAQGQTPPVDAFWSMTMFDTRRALAENAIQRYAIGSRTEGLKHNADGSLDLFIQSDTPRGHESNWLPAPAAPFLLMLRMYLPKRELLNGTYQIPPVSRSDEP